MALATQCPHCHTTFRVAHDQLKLRAGLVRCGVCKQIFNGIENLLRPEDMEAAPAAAGSTVPAPVSPAQPPAPPASAPPGPPPVPQPLSVPEPAPQPAGPPAASAPTMPIVDFDLGDYFDDDDDDKPAAQPAAPRTDPDAMPDAADDTDGATPSSVSQAGDRKDDPLLRMTLMDIAPDRREPAMDHSAPASADAAQDDPVEQALDDLESRPWRREQETSPDDDALDRAESAEYEEPNFVKQGRRRQRIGRVLRAAMMTGSAILFLALLLQSAYVFRNRIAALFPQTKPVLAAICMRLGCQVGLPAQIEAVSIESSELQTLAADASTFALTVLLRNHGATDQAWPGIELTLNDASEKPVARRVFLPREYLTPPLDVNKGLGARSEQVIRLYFELTQLKASGYRVYLFYP